MSDARIAQVGTPAEIYENPRTEFVATFIEEANILGGQMVSRAGGQAGGGAGGQEGRRSDGQTVEPTGHPPARRHPPELPPLGPPAHPPIGPSDHPPVRIAIRPEWMDLFRVGEVPPGENSLPGTVRDVIYLGETIHVLVALDDGTPLKVALRNVGQLIKPLPWKAGDRVAVGWLPEDCQVLEEA